MQKVLIEADIQSVAESLDTVDDNIQSAAEELQLNEESPMEEPVAEEAVAEEAPAAEEVPAASKEENKSE